MNRRMLYLSAAGLFLTAYFLLQSVLRLRRIGIRSRAILKMYHEGALSESGIREMRLFLIMVLLLSVFLCLLVAAITVPSDYSFMAGTFPVVWLYYLQRYLLWERSDIRNAG